MSKAPRISTLALCLLPLPAAAVERLLILPFGGINVHPSLAHASQDLLRQHLNRRGTYEIVTLTPPAEGLAAAPSAAEVQAHAAQVGARWVVTGQITRLSGRASVAIDVHDVAAGRITYSDQLQAGSPDDLDPVLQRLATSILDRRPARGNADIETVTEREEEAPLKRHATNSFGLRLGAITALDGELDGTGGLLGVFWLYDARSFLADVALEFGGEDDVGNYFAVVLGAYYPFSRGDLSPYLGGGLQLQAVSGPRDDEYNALEDDDEDGGGLAAFVAGGLLMGRLATVQPRADVKLFSGVTGDDRVTGVVFSAGIGF